MQPDPSILQCPLTGADLSFVSQETLKELKHRVATGEWTYVAGSPVQMSFDGALSAPGGEIVYPVQDGILILLPGSAIVPAKSVGTFVNVPAVSGTDDVMRFYDQVGWQQESPDTFVDADLFEDLHPVSREYIHRCHMRINTCLRRPGRYLLDVASGPVQYSDYLSYSEGYDFRICADVSVTALRAARQKVGERGIYIQCDITRLPLKAASVDGFVSLHTIYHVPREKQHAAFNELERVLKPERTGAVVYSWGDHCLAMRVLTKRFGPIRAAKQVVKWMIGRRDAVSPSPGARELYFYAHDYEWFRREIASRGGWDIRVWRSVSVPFLKQHAHESLLGRQLLSILFSAEEALPRFLGRFGQYPIMVYRKGA